MNESSSLTLPEILEPTTPQAVLDNVDRVRELVLAEADRSDAEGRLSPIVAQAFRDAGFFQMGFAKRVGGLEMTVLDQVRVTARISRLDSGAGWNVGVLNATGIYASRLPREVYDKLYPTRDLPTSGSFHPRGHAERVADGYLVSGEWDWGSGSHIAEYVIGGCEIFENGQPVLKPNGKQLFLGLWLPLERITWKENWNVLGQRGSGSRSYSIDEPVFVPEGHGFDREPDPDPDTDPLSKHVTTVFYALGGVHLGLAQRAVDLAYEAVMHRADGNPSAIDAATKRSLGQAIAEVDVAASYVMDVARRTDEVIFTPGRVLDPVEEARQDSVNLMTGRALRRAIELCTELYGSYFVYDGNPLQRVVRDTEVALTHAGARPMHWIRTADTALREAAGAVTLFDDPLVSSS
ncbi:MAG: acyl-CoA dehydrogenase family protein [Gaiellales bacterium]